MSQKKTQTPAWVWIVITFCVVALFVAVMAQDRSNKNVTNFQTCKDAGGAIMESYPEQCAIDGMTFTNDAQSLDTDPRAYIGLSEKAAFDKAAAANKSARVVERDGESLPVTMDYMPGRLNFHVKDGKVVEVKVEGEE